MAIDLTRISERAAQKAALLDALEPTRKQAREKTQELWRLEREKKEGAKTVLQDRALLDSHIPGYFPTPPTLAARMIAKLKAPIGAMFLEPSAGGGAVAKAGMDAGLTPYCIEYNYSLYKALCQKGFNAYQGDFLDFPLPMFSYICMNPPFENRADIRHVLRAWSLLQPGGTLVAIMSAGTLYRSDRETVAFREFLEGQDYEQENLPAGTFALSGTNVSSVLFTINKGE